MSSGEVILKRYAFWSLVIYLTFCDIDFTCFCQSLQQMRSDVALLTLEDGGQPIQNPSTAAEDARLASLISLDGILKQVKVLPPYHILFCFVDGCTN